MNQPSLNLPVFPLTADEIAAYRAGKIDLLNEVSVYERLFTYYCDSNEMPYGVAKARDGDPYAWIEHRLARDL